MAGTGPQRARTPAGDWLGVLSASPPVIPSKFPLRAPETSLRDEEGDALRLQVLRELASVYTDVIAGPVPAEVRQLIEALEQRYRARPFPKPSRTDEGPTQIGGRSLSDLISSREGEPF